ncbi:hypothetical protein [Dysgonomonas sp. ZJ709]|uniref:hypothetical protein n=1 Tax=Dysgonomonas sp. ZJ709 TaxID=2709797 RepID=UPI0013EC2EB3|nr:hypothetical protein [Dysgonomonas sp. ZJ709]
MKVNLTINLDTESSFRSKLLSNMNHLLQDYFQDKKYENDLEQILIGVIIVKRVPGYEKWYNPRRPKYIYHKALRDPIFKDKTYEINKTYECEFRFSEDDYNRFISESEKESNIILGTYILETLSDLSYLCKKLKDFNKEEFINDLINCLKENGYLSNVSD